MGAKSEIDAELLGAILLEVQAKVGAVLLSTPFVILVVLQSVTIVFQAGMESSCRLFA